MRTSLRGFPADARWDSSCAKPTRTECDKHRPHDSITDLSGDACTREPVVATPDADEQGWNDEERDGRRDSQAADHGQGQWFLQLAPGAQAERQGQQSE